MITDTTTGKQDQANFGVDFIAKPQEQIWSDGATVLVYPDGTVVNRLTGRLIKAGVKAHLIINTLLFQLMVRNSAPASYITSGAITLTNDSQLYQLTNENFVCNTVRLLASAGNAGTVYIGSDSNISATSGALQLSAGESINLAFSDSKKIKLVASDAGDIIQYSLFTQ